MKSIILLSGIRLIRLIGMGIVRFGYMPAKCQMFRYL
jgi:hypothetical protein